MPFCPSCGKENAVGAQFCPSCGKKQVGNFANCSNCGKALEENEKFCSGCGTPAVAKVKSPVTKPPQKKEEKRTKEGRKIIDAGPKPNQSRTKIPFPPPPIIKPPKKKKRGPVGCFFRTLFILISIVLGAALIIVVANVLFVEDDETTVSNTQNIDNKAEISLTDTNIPGIVDIEPGDESHLPENRNKESEQVQFKTIKENEDLKKVAKTVEVAFTKADTTQLKLLMAEPALSIYSGVFKEMQPYMEELGKAFKNRTLITATEIYQIYEFMDDKGEKYTAAFELQADGNWKLTRF
jgi:ribosomal protein L37E